MGDDHMIFPWQETSWQQVMRLRSGLDSSLDSGLPHALLFAGAEGIGKQQFIEAMAQALLCLKPQPDTQMACGVCEACHLVNKGNHPDLLSLAPENSQKIISIDDIRALINFSQSTPQLANCRVALLHDAHSMQSAGANALLKTLEEPAPGVYLLLQTAYPLQLLPTLRSRCQRVNLALPARDLAVEWLKTQLNENNDIKRCHLLLNIARGSPQRALSLAEPSAWQARLTVMDSLLNSQETISALALRMTDIPLVTILSFWHGILSDLSKLVLDNTLSEDFLINTDYYIPIANIVASNRSHGSVLQSFASALQMVQGSVRRRVAINHLLTLEDLLLKWQSILHGKQCRV